jgi:hypothetical protein
MKKKLILSAVFVTIGSIVCIAINQVRKSKYGGKKQVIVKRLEISQAFMIDTFKPIEDFEMIYFDQHRGLVEIKTLAK